MEKELSDRVLLLGLLGLTGILMAVLGTTYGVFQSPVSELTTVIVEELDQNGNIVHSYNTSGQDYKEKEVGWVIFENESVNEVSDRIVVKVYDEDLGENITYEYKTEEERRNNPPLTKEQARRHLEIALNDQQVQEMLKKAVGEGKKYTYKYPGTIDLSKGGLVLQIIDLMKPDEICKLPMEYIVVYIVNGSVVNVSHEEEPRVEEGFELHCLKKDETDELMNKALMNSTVLDALKDMDYKPNYYLASRIKRPNEQGVMEEFAYLRVDLTPKGMTRPNETMALYVTNESVEIQWIERFHEETIYP
jgi:hypothetical protein